MNPYQKLHRTIELLDKGDFNSSWVIGRPGIGKSFQVDEKLAELGSNHVVFTGDVTEARFFEFLQEHNNKLIILRDSSKFLRQISFIDILKQATETTEPRTISRLNYSNHIGTRQTFDFTGKILIEVNEIGKKYKNDLEALFSRGLVNELTLSQDEIKQVMKEICKTKEDTMITDYLISKSAEFGNNLLNLRVQNMCFKLYIAAQRDKLDWKKEVDQFLETQKSDAVKLLYRFAGNSAVRRIEFIKYLIESQDWSLSTTKRRVSQWLELGEINSNGMLKQDLISINKQ